MMIKVYFTCDWETSSSFHQKISKNTPRNKGIWKNIILVDNFREAEYLIVLDNLNKEFVSIGPKKFLSFFANEKIIHFQRENNIFINNNTWYRKNILPNLINNFSNNYIYTFTTANFLNKNYDELKKIKYPEKRKILSCVISAKNYGETYIKRKNFIIKYSNSNKGKIDIFGKDWKNELGSNYKGELGSYHQNTDKNTSKLDGLIDYKYSICLENFPKDNILSEKITDSILSWTFPIYSGPEVTTKYYPKNSFYLIDINNIESLEEINKIIEKEVDIEALEEARNLILDKYNIWEQIYQIINNRDNFEENYRVIK